jgi:hypothetical protein
VVGVTNGSALGPLLLALSIAPFSQFIGSFDVYYHQYADDTQIINPRESDIMRFSSGRGTRGCLLGLMISDTPV